MKQSRFSSNPEDSKVVWPIPLFITTDKGPLSTSFILEKAEDTVEIPYSNEEDSFYKINHQSKSFVRVLRSKSQNEKLLRLLTDKTDRIATVNDAFAMAQMGRSSTSEFLELVSLMKHEESAIVLIEIAMCLSDIERECLKIHESTLKRVNDLRVSIFLPKFEKYGWEFDINDSFDVTRTRAISIITLAHAGHQAVVSEFCRRMHEFTSDNVMDALHPDLIEEGFRTLLLNSLNPEQDFEYVLKIYQESDNETWSSFALQSLGSTSELSLIQRILSSEFALDSSIVRKVDLIGLLKGICSSRCSFRDDLRALLNKWLQEKWTVLCQRYGGTVILGKLAGLVVSFGEGDLHLEDVKKFRDSNSESFAPIKTQMEQALERVDINNTWRKQFN